MYFYNSSNTLLNSASVVVDKDVDKPDYKLKEFTITSVAPVATYYIKVEGSIGCNTLKMDALCLTVTNTPSLGCIGDKVWADANCNGIQDSGEPGICGVTVQLKNSVGIVIATTTTNSSGAYKFSGLTAGNYTVVFPAALSGSVLTSSIVGSNRDVDSDPSQATGATAVIALAAGQTITNVDAGYCANVMSLGNRVWYDANCNGINDNANELGIANVTLNLYKDNNNDNVADGAAIATTTTDANGYYMFNNLIPGNYIVGVVTPAGYVKAVINGGDPDNNINLDNNGVSVVGNETRGLAITLTAGAEPNGSCGGSNTNITYDFGFCQSSSPTTCDCTNSTSNLLTNGSFENGNTGWTVSGGNLTTGTGYVICGSKNAFLAQTSGTAKVWQQVTTIVAGSTVTFKGWSGTHTAGISCSPKLTLSFYTSANVLISSSSVTVDKNVDVPDYKLKEYTISALAPAGTYYTRVEGSIGCNVLKLDALCLTATPPVLGCLGDLVWTDLNANGIQDAGEPGIAGVTVTLTYPNNTTATTATDANGLYKFCSLAAGTYTITFGNPGSQYVPTVSNAGSDDTKDSDPIAGVVSGITLEPGETNLTIDAGFILKNLNLGDFVWNDQNANGKQDAGEVGVAGVTVNLYADADGDNVADGAAIAATVTNAGGLYGFGSLAPGKYLVGVVIPAGYAATVTTASSATPDNDDNTDNNGVITTSGELFSNSITLSNAGEPTADGDGNNGNLTLDFGLIGVASLGDFVWNDLNANGIQDAGEPGIAGVSVTLTYPNNATLATVTDANGLYLFSNLAPGSYKVTFGTSAGFAVSPSNVGSDDTKDSDPIGGVVSGITLAAGDVNLTIDAGFYKVASIGNFVWFDKNANGIQDAGEPGIENVTVQLFSCADVLVATTTTNSSGIYGFSNLTPGSYYVVFTAPSGYLISAAGQGGDATKDSDANPLTGKTSCVTLVSGESNITIDAGLYQAASLGDFVWNDKNANGIQDAGEPGIENVTVQLFSCADVLVATTTTNSSGIYGFSNLTPGSYYVVFTAPSGYSISAAGQGGDATKDSDANPLTGKTSCVTLVSGESNITIDAGLYQATSLGDFVWYDQNANGIQDAGETGVGNVTVQLFSCADVLVATTTTNSNGIYGFSNLTPGSYYVVITAPAGYSITAAGQGGDVTKDSDANPLTGKTTCVTLTSGESNITIDAGLTGTGSIGDFVWHDLDADGIQGREPGKPNVKVTLTYPNGTTATVLTDAAGKYLFSNLAPGTYSVAFETPVDFIPSPSDQGSDDSKDSDPVGGVVTGIVLAPGENNLTIDAGFYCHFNNLGNFVWNDQNNNGIQDAGEPGISAVTVNLYRDANGDNIADGAAVATTTTDANGFYGFSSLTPGKYIVGVIIPDGYAVSATTSTSATPDNDDNADNNGVSTVAGELFSNAITLITFGEPTTDGDGVNGNLTLDFGLKGTASLGDFVWNDVNVNGIQDAGETGIPNVTVTLYSCANVLVATTTTNAGGIYSFTGLTPGSYYVMFTSPSGFSFSVANQGGDITKDSDANPATGKTACITLVAGESNITADAGLFQPVSLGDFVWMDGNANGIQEPGEPGIPNVSVALYTCANVLVATTTTNATGYYSFTGITAGSYYVLFNAPSGYFFSPSKKGTDITIDSDPNVSTFKSSCVTLAAGDNNNTIDAGLYQKVSLGNFVWSDKNNNGIQDGGLEIGFTGLRVYLYQDANGDNLPDGPSVATAVTLPNGLYSFTGLTPGKYIVGLVVPAGYLPGANTATSANPDNDNNTDNNGVRVAGGQFYSNSITLVSNGEPTNDGDDFNGNTTLDFGLACGCPSARGISSNTSAIQPSLVTYKGFNVTGVYPNPFVDRVSISYTSELVQKVGIRIVDNTGRTVYNTQSTVQAGKNNMQLSDLNRLAAGSYIVEIKTSTAVYNQKLVK